MFCKPVVALSIMFLLAGIASGASYTDLPTFLAATSNLTLVNFDTDPDGVSFSGALTGVYSEWGVEFQGEDYSSSASGPVSSPNAWFVSGSTTPFDAVFTIGGVTAVGLHHALFSGQSGATLYAYDSGDNLLESAISDSDGDTLDFFGVITDEPISWFEVILNQPPGGWALDDLYFGGPGAGKKGNGGEIPEPGTLALVGAGLLAAAVVRKKRR